MLTSYVISGVTLEVKTGAEFKNYICKRIYASLWAVLVNFNVTVVDFRKIVVLPAWVRLDITLGIKQYAYYENMIAEWISRRLGVVNAVMGCFIIEILTFSVILSWVLSVISSKVRLGHSKTIVRCLEEGLILLKASRPECHVAQEDT